jgi:UDP-glucuronate decarboxylase
VSLQGNRDAAIPKPPEWLHPTDRILITGASGWFGTTFLEMIRESCAVMTTGSARGLTHKPWNLNEVRRFSPTIVANFAFNTRDKITSMGEAQYSLENRKIIEEMARSFSMPHVRLGFTVSSGAALQKHNEKFQDAYSELKDLEERVAQSLISPSRKIVVGRVFSVSGPFVRNVNQYAFSHFVYQALHGRIEVRASVPTFRRYVAIDDFLNVCMSFGSSGSGLIESGGDLVEMSELAIQIRNLVNSRAELHLPHHNGGDSEIYASDNVTWKEALGVTGIVPKSLDEQIASVASFLRRVIQP